MDRCVLVCLYLSISLSPCMCVALNRPPIARFYYIIHFFLQFNFIERFIRSEFDFSIIASISQIKRIYTYVCLCVRVYV